MSASLQGDDGIVFRKLKKAAGEESKHLIGEENWKLKDG